MFCQRTREQWGNSVTNLTLLLLALTAKNKCVVETLKPRGFANGDASVFSIVDKSTRAGIGKIGGDGLRDSVAMQTPICLAQVFNFSSTVKTTAPIQILIAAAFWNFF
jgi:hypothetical protein